MHLRDNGGITYRYYKTPVLPFGFGLLTTNFSVAFEGGRECSTTTEALADHFVAYYESGGEDKSPVSFDISVRNTGSRPSAVVLAAWVYSNHSDAPPKKLGGFKRVGVLAPGQARIVTISLPGAVLAIVDPVGQQQILPGQYSVTIDAGDPSVLPVSTTFTVSGDPVTTFALG